MLILAAIMVLPLLKRQLKEIKILSVILFFGIGLFLTMMILELGENGSNLNPDDNYAIYYTFKWSLSTVSSLGVILVAYGF